MTDVNDKGLIDRNQSRDVVLDLIRGVSALLVFLGHVRGFVFRDFSELVNPSKLYLPIYFVTGLGHQAVVVFFVLSGYFVGGSVLKDLRRGKFSWSNYALARLTRLWVALLPALVMTAVVDGFGKQMFPEAYAGRFYSQYRMGPSADRPLDLSLMTFLGNLTFLQTIVVPTYGTNGPLWSLANEFWYYTLFPLAMTSFGVLQKTASERRRGVASLLLMTAVLMWLPRQILVSGVNWLIGVAVWWLSQNHLFQQMVRNRVWRILSGSLFVAAVAASKTSSFLGQDFCLAFTFALWLLSIIGSLRVTNLVRWLGIGLSEISYTLYVVHFPLVFLLAAVICGDRQFSPGLFGLAVFSSIVAISLAFAVGMWWIFESNTGKIRKAVSRSLGLERPPSLQP